MPWVGCSAAGGTRRPPPSRCDTLVQLRGRAPRHCSLTGGAVLQLTSACGRSQPCKRDAADHACTLALWWQSDQMPFRHSVESCLSNSAQAAAEKYLVLLYTGEGSCRRGRVQEEHPASCAQQLDGAASAHPEPHVHCRIFPVCSHLQVAFQRARLAMLCTSDLTCSSM